MVNSGRFFEQSCVAGTGSIVLSILDAFSWTRLFADNLAYFFPALEPVISSVIFRDAYMKNVVMCWLT